MLPLRARIAKIFSKIDFSVKLQLCVGIVAAIIRFPDIYQHDYD